MEYNEIKQNIINAFEQPSSEIQMEALHNAINDLYNLESESGTGLNVILEFRDFIHEYIDLNNI